MVYGKLGRYPLIINVKVRMIAFWSKLAFSQNNKVSSKLQYVMGKMNRPWFKFIVKILNDCALSFILYQQNVNIQWLKRSVFHILLDQFKQSWNSEMYNSSKGINYRIFKTTLSLEKYLLDLSYVSCLCI